MSYSRGTPNFNLPQTQGSDKRDWSDTNAAFLAVDTALKTASDTASSASSAAGTAQNRADSAYSLASTANTAAGNAATAAATAGELAQTAKNRADSAYTLAGGKQDALSTISGTYTPIDVSASGVSAQSGDLKKYGNVVTLSIEATVSVYGISGFLKIGSVPTGYRPSGNRTTALGFSVGGATGELRVASNGDVSVRVVGQLATIPAFTHGNITFVI